MVAQNECFSKGTLERIKSTDVVVLGVFLDQAPFSSYNSDTNEFMGYQVDICKFVVEEIKKNLYSKLFYIGSNPAQHGKTHVWQLVATHS